MVAVVAGLGLVGASVGAAVLSGGPVVWVAAGLGALAFGDLGVRIMPGEGGGWPDTLLGASFGATAGAALGGSAGWILSAGMRLVS